MAVTIKLKNASGSDPSASDLVLGELAVRTDNGKIFLKKDIRKVGSGNIGTTNVLRTGNKFLAIATLVFDLLKGSRDAKAKAN